MWLDVACSGYALIHPPGLPSITPFEEPLPLPLASNTDPCMIFDSARALPALLPASCCAFVHLLGVPSLGRQRLSVTGIKVK